MNPTTKKAANSFGPKGWSMIFYCVISYYLAAVLSTDTLNWYPTAFAAIRPEWGGAETVSNLSNMMAGVGGWLGVVAAIVFSVMAAKKGSKFMAVLGNFLCGIVCIIMALTPSLPIFCAMVICNTFIAGNIQLNVVPNNIMNIWFPRKKGLALGWATMGLPICTATIILILSAIGNATIAYIAIGIICFAFGIISIFWVKNTPEEVGAIPDNEEMDPQLAKELMERQAQEAKKLTTGVILKNRNTWMIGLGLGFLWMTTIGLVSNFITHLIACEVDYSFAVGMLTFAALIGIVGSYIWGILDLKIGTKKACLIYGIWYLVALLLMIFLTNSKPMVLLAAIFVGFGIGGIGNLIPSMIGTCFGRFGFIEANRAIAPMNTAIRSCALVIISIIGVTHLSLSYWVFFAFVIIGIIMIFLIKIPKYDSETGDPIGIYGDTTNN
ncbi:MAG: MFS transporter [Eubacterium sp.]|nr:MFS transporter [Eubacterium sp.]